jgi:hypothetical protein
MKHNALLVAASAALLGPLAHAQVIAVQWDAGGRFEQQVPVPVGKFVELCERLGPGTRVQWRFDAPSPLNFNIHYHEGNELRFPAREDHGLASKGTLDVASEQDYCWMWTNKTSVPVSVSVKMARDR